MTSVSPTSFPSFSGVDSLEGSSTVFGPPAASPFCVYYSRSCLPPLIFTAATPPERTLTHTITPTPITTTFVSASGSPEASPGTTGDTQNGGISTTALAGLSLGLGLLVGLIGATIIYVYRRRRAAAARKARGEPRDGEALLGYRDEEKQMRLDSPVAPPAPVPNARIMDWVQLNRATSFSSVASSYFPTIVSDSQSTVVRSQSMASSKSAYSQASAFRGRASDENHYEFEGGPSRPPELYRINE
ncbi:hypothetical protein B0H19DRAFT_1094635 [Mycena capillaripes]|nr:hypothetical protein B0H19DRAFT_1094635 [Mycena capillaripes]